MARRGSDLAVFQHMAAIPPGRPPTTSYMHTLVVAHCLPPACNRCYPVSLMRRSRAAHARAARKPLARCSDASPLAAGPPLQRRPSAVWASRWRRSGASWNTHRNERRRQLCFPFRDRHALAIVKEHAWANARPHECRRKGSGAGWSDTLPLGCPLRPGPPMRLRRASSVVRSAPLQARRLRAQRCPNQSSCERGRVRRTTGARS